MQRHGCYDCIGKLGLCLAFDGVQQGLITEYIDLIHAGTRLADWRTICNTGNPFTL